MYRRRMGYPEKGRAVLQMTVVPLPPAGAIAALSIAVRSSACGHRHPVPVWWRAVLPAAPASFLVQHFAADKFIIIAIVSDFPC